MKYLIIGLADLKARPLLAKLRPCVIGAILYNGNGKNPPLYFP